MPHEYPLNFKAEMMSNNFWILKWLWKWLVSQECQAFFGTPYGYTILYYPCYRVPIVFYPKIPNLIVGAPFIWGPCALFIWCVPIIFQFIFGAFLVRPFYSKSVSGGFLWLSKKQGSPTRQGTVKRGTPTRRGTVNYSSLTRRARLDKTGLWALT